MTEISSQVERDNLADLSWPFWPIVPLYPYGRRRTLCQEVVEDTIWTFEQVQGIFYVVVPIRMSVVKLSEGGLLVYAPIAPTLECIRLMERLVAKHGEVKYIVLPTISGVEHKVFVGPFARCFPRARVFIAPNQWSFPLNLPYSWLGLPRKRTFILPAKSAEAPFASEFDYEILGPIALGPGSFSEVVFFHKRSRTLLVTDTIVSVPEEASAIVQLDPYPLLFHAKENAFESVEDNRDSRRQGWQRICLFALYLQPNALKTVGWGRVWRDAFKAPDRSKKAYFGLFPFQWQEDWQESFATLRGDGRPMVAPILQTLILNRAPKEVLDWVDRVAGWNFERIIACHFDSPIMANPSLFRQAFAFLKKDANQSARLLPDRDFELLRGVDRFLSDRRIVPPAKKID